MSKRPMDCAEIRDALLVGTAPAGPDVDLHVRGCEACAELLSDRGTLGRALSQPGTPDTLESSELWSSLERAVTKETGPRAWLRSRATPVRIALSVAVAAVVVLFGGRPPPGQSVDAPLPWVVAFGLGGIACLAILVAPLGRPRAPSVVRAGLIVAAVTLPLGYALGEGVHESNAPPSSITGEIAAPDFAAQAFGCFAYGALLSLPFLLVLFALERSDRPRSSLLVGLGGVAGLVANVALALHCPNIEVGHLGAGHASIGVLFASLGAIVGPLLGARKVAH